MQSLRLGTGLSVGEFSDLHLGLEIHPPSGRDNGVALICLPGGGMRRQFFDLPVDGQRSFSFSEALCRQGFTCVLVDHPGIGDSDQPENGYLLSPELLARAHHHLLQRLREQPALQGKRTVGVGHSMGAMITLIQQAEHHSHDGIALLGFGFDGLPQYLHPKVRAMLDDRERLLAQVVDLARKFFRVNYPLIQGGGGGIYAGEQAERVAIAGIKRVATHLLPLPAFMSMLPQQWNAQAAQVNVPVLVALGDNDLVKPPDNARQVFSSSPEVEVMVLPQTGHSPFLFASRFALFERLGQWAGTLSN